MAAVTAGIVRPVMKAEVAGLPVGKALIFSAAMGVGDVLKALAFKFSGDKVPQWAVGGILAYALLNVKGVKGLLGADVSELAALAIISDTLNDQFALRQRTSDFLSNLFGGETISKSPPVWQSNQGTAATSGGPSHDLYKKAF